MCKSGGSAIIFILHVQKFSSEKIIEKNQLKCPQSRLKITTYTNILNICTLQYCWSVKELFVEQIVNTLVMSISAFVCKIVFWTIFGFLSQKIDWTLSFMWNTPTISPLGNNAATFILHTDINQHFALYFFALLHSCIEAF